MSDAEYARRLERLQEARWKTVLDVQRPYRWNIQRHCPGRVLEVGCGTGRNLRNLRGRAVGVDINAEAVALARAKGFTAYTAREFLAGEVAAPESFDCLLLAHVLEHVDRETSDSLLGDYLPFLRPGGTVMMICPQERGYASDPTHIRWVDFAVLAGHCQTLGLRPVRHYSFPFPRALGRAFIYNEFIQVARKP